MLPFISKRKVLKYLIQEGRKASTDIKEYYEKAEKCGDSYFEEQHKRNAHKYEIIWRIYWNMAARLGLNVKRFCKETGLTLGDHGKPTPIA